MDGVIATPKRIDTDGTWGIVEECEKNLGLILAQTGADLVISSSWRYESVEKTKEFFAQKGFSFCDKIIGVTIRAYHYIEKGMPMSIPRGVEIEHWIDNYIHRDYAQGTFKRKIEGEDFRFVILDDNTDMLLSQSKNFVLCNSEFGLTEHETKQAIYVVNEGLQMSENARGMKSLY